MSLGEATQLFEILQDCNLLASEINFKIEDLHKRIERTEVFITAQQALRVFWRLSSLMTKMGLPKDAAQAIKVLTKIAHVATYTYYAMHLLMMGTPYGMVAGVVGLTTSFISAGLIFEGY